MRRLLASVLVAVLLVGVPAATQPIAAARVMCSVENARTGAITHTLQEAVDASAKGDTLRIRGTCVGGTVIRYTTLRLEGVPTTEQPTPTLDGGGVGRVLNVRARVVLRNLRVTNGRARYGAGVWLLGRLSLEGDTSITGNKAQQDGGGIWANGTITLNDSSSVSGNTATYGGGVLTSSTITLNGSSSVSGNTASFFGGGIMSYGSTLALNDSSSVRGNTAPYGGGIYLILSDGGTLTLNGSSSVTGNIAREQGGGIDIYGTGTLALNGSSSVRRNTAPYGGGILMEVFSTVRLNDSSRVVGNSATKGGGIFVDDTTASLHLDDDASVTGNTASKIGGGVFAPRGEVFVCSSGVAISPNDPDDPPETLPCP